MAAFNTDNLDPKELKGMMTKFNKLKAELFGPEIIDLKHNLKEIVLMKFEESSKELKTMLAKHDIEVREKQIGMDLALENYGSIQRTHREFVDYLDEVILNLNKRIDTVDYKINYIEKRRESNAELARL
jgi:hypothetical protein